MGHKTQKAPPASCLEELLSWHWDATQDQVAAA
jgi:hypothetical protein